MFCQKEFIIGKRLIENFKSNKISAASQVNSWQKTCLVKAGEISIILDSFPLDGSVLGQN